MKSALVRVRRLIRIKSPKLEEKPDIRWALTAPIPETIIGKGNAFYLSGWCYHPEHKVRNLEVMLDDCAQPVEAFGLPTPAVHRLQYPTLDPKGLSYHAGFLTVVNVPKYEQPSTVTVRLKATLDDGTWRTWTLGQVLIEPSMRAAFPMPAVEVPSISSRPLIAICMTTYDPPAELFSQQLQSIRDQTYDNWVCIICDDHSRPDIFERIRASVEQDSRFHLYRNSSNLGFYYNYERCLSLVPEAADFVALCDHDDYWYADKLETLLAQFDEETTLVYSDMRLVDEDGVVVSNTFWTTRPNNYRNLASLLITNTVTGAASLFRRRLLEYAIPLPTYKLGAFHDQWIACVALATGRVNYVERPLYSYFQHRRNVVGHYAPSKTRLSKTVFTALRTLWPRRVTERARSAMESWKGEYYWNVLRIQSSARILEARCGRFLTGAKLRAVRRLQDMDRSFFRLSWLSLRGINNAWRVNATLGAEYKLLRGIAWRRLLNVRRWKFPHGEQDLIEFGPFEQECEPAQPDEALFAHQKTAPLSLTPHSGAPQRLNLLLPSIDFKYFFGGYITKLNLARRLAERGYRVRLVIVDPPEAPSDEPKDEIDQYDGLRDIFEAIEVAYAYDRREALEVNPRDHFIATTWWTAHIAHRAAETLGNDGFVYLIQEYEPFTFTMGSFAALANQSYELPHSAIFSTELLRDYFRQNGIGVYAEGQDEGDRRSISFQNAITTVGPIHVDDLSARRNKRVLFYARPEPHNARNMFELGVLAFRGAVESGYFDEEWEFYGIGSTEKWSRISLGNGRFLEMITRQSQSAYRELLRCHDLGLSLMYTPHPSLVPIEMAAAGMVTVTNTFANKTSDALKQISSNLVPVEPTVAGVVEGLRYAASLARDYKGRAAGASVQWSTEWDASFDDIFLARLADFIKSTEPEELNSRTATNSLKKRSG